ncbi:DNA repair protein RadC [Oscillochloris sp. ZM17-4]|nr:DNA repair protein RadC [Oscillochloris sp. ZM17-4]
MGLLGKSAPELEQLGLTKRKAAILAAAIEISRRSMIAGIDQRPQITSPADAATLLMVEMGHLDQEHLRTVLLDTKNRVMAMPTIYIGSVNTAAIRVGEVFKEAIRRNATALIVVHNHPSGDPTPSPEDILVTRQIVEAGKLLDCDVLDHLVIGRGRYTSMRERGLGFAK